MNKDTLVLAFGRAAPPSAGHALLFNKVKSIARKVKGDHVVILSKTQDAKKNPLNVEDKVEFAKKIAPGVNIIGATKEHPTIMHHIEKAHDEGIKHLHIVAGSDRIDEYKTLVDKYHGPNSKKPFESITYHSAGDRDPDAEGVSGISGTKMREFAKNNDIESYKKGLPDHVEHADAVKMMNRVREGMGIKESVELEESLADRLAMQARKAAQDQQNAKTATQKANAARTERRALSALDMLRSGSSEEEAQRHFQSGGSIKSSKYSAPIGGKPKTFKIGVTVSDPSHPAASMRKTQLLRYAKVSAVNRDEAMEKAMAFYQRQGYKVHDTFYHSQLAESEDQLNLLSLTEYINDSDIPNEPEYIDFELEESEEINEEAEYKGRKVQLNKPFRTTSGPKKFAVYVKNANGKVIIVRFGDPNLSIKTSNDERRKSFRARHNCDTASDKTSPRYWSCRAWSSKDAVKNLLD